MRRPRLAEMVAAQLREQIVTGEIPDGSALPTLEKLVHLFDVGAPSVREAFGILEHEGLITVRRGNLGGAIVHRPKAETAAYMLGLVLQARETAAADVAQALTNLEPMCARLAAERPDRETAVLPILEDLNDQMTKSFEGGAEFVRLASMFHRELVNCCGNDSLALVAWSLELLWYAQPVARDRESADEVEAPDLELRRQGISAHSAIIDAIRDGDGVLVEKLVRDHITHPEAYGVPQEGSAMVSATHLRGEVVAKTEEAPVRPSQ